MDPITHQLSVRAAPDVAYAAFATEAGIKAWWCTNSTVGESVGAATTLVFNHAGMPGPVTMRFQTETLEPGRRVVWACTANDNPAWPGTKLTWEVAPRAGGSSVTFTHDGWKDGGPMYDQTVQGWRPFMASLQSYLDGGEATPSAYRAP